MDISSLSLISVLFQAAHFSLIPSCTLQIGGTFVVVPGLDWSLNVLSFVAFILGANIEHYTLGSAHYYPCEPQPVVAWPCPGPYFHRGKSSLADAAVASWYSVGFTQPLSFPRFPSWQWVHFSLARIVMQKWWCLYRQLPLPVQMEVRATI